MLDGGSMYWVIKGVMCARQPIIELRSMQRADGRPACGTRAGADVTAHDRKEEWEEEHGKGTWRASTRR